MASTSTSISTSVPIYGNYHGYYTSKRPPSGPTLRDPRLVRLPQDLFKGKKVLDVGCNEGWVSCEIAQSLGASQVTGVDIDDTLIQGAWKRRRTSWSLQEPPAAFLHSSSRHNSPSFEGEGTLEAEEEDGNHSRRKKRKRVSSDEEGDGGKTERRLKANYFPLSFEHEFGSLPIPPRELEGKGGSKFPHNLTFRTANWLTEEVEEGAYDVVLALSITKWIHLHTLDTGLLSFFTKIHSSLKPGGVLVLEKQGWESYTKARRMSETLKRNYQSLTLRPEEFERVLGEVGFARRELTSSAATGNDVEGGLGVREGKEGGGFDRPIELYVKL